MEVKSRDVLFKFHTKVWQENKWPDDKGLSVYEPNNKKIDSLIGQFPL